MTIPPITDPLGKEWPQPSLDEILIDDDCAMMTQQAQDKLRVYNGSLPSGTYTGKMWMCCLRDGYHLCWYGEIEGNEIRVHHKRIVTA